MYTSYSKLLLQLESINSRLQTLEADYRYKVKGSLYQAKLGHLRDEVKAVVNRMKLMGSGIIFKIEYVVVGLHYEVYMVNVREEDIEKRLESLIGKTVFNIISINKITALKPSLVK